MPKKYPYNLLTEYFLSGNNITEDLPYEIKDISAQELVTPERIDLLAKWIYIDAKEKGMHPETAKQLYLKHIEAFSEGTFTEPGNEDKNSIEKYFQEFDILIEDFKQHGFNEQKSLVPIGKDNILLDGAHRTTCALYFHKKLRVIKFENIKRDYGTAFFKKRGLDERYLDRMVMQYCKLQPNIYMACLWQTADEKLRGQAKEILEKECGKIVYVKDIALNYTGLRNFMMQVYGHQKWIGTLEDGHKGLDDKVIRCYKKGSPLTAVVFHCDNLDKVINVKAKIRDLFHLENDSIHISDTDEETRLMADILLNENSRHFLRCGDMDFSPKVNALMQELKQQKNDSLLLGPDCTMAIYGLKEMKEEKPEVLREEKTVGKEFYMQGKNAQDLLFDPQNFFSVNNIKFISLPNVKLKKKQEHSWKNRKDIIKINKKLRLKDAKQDNRRFEKTKKKAGRTFDQCKAVLIYVTQKLHVYHFLLKVYHFLKE